MAPSSDDLKAIRRSLGLGQKALAYVLGVSAVTVSRWETGKSVPSRENLTAILNLAHQGVPPEWAVAATRNAALPTELLDRELRYVAVSGSMSSLYRQDASELVGVDARVFVEFDHVNELFTDFISDAIPRDDVLHSHTWMPMASIDESGDPLDIMMHSSHEHIFEGGKLIAVRSTVVGVEPIRGDSALVVEVTTKDMTKERLIYK